MTNMQPRQLGKWSCRREEQDLIICMGILTGGNPSQSTNTVICGLPASTKCKTPYSTCDTEITITKCHKTIEQKVIRQANKTDWCSVEGVRNERGKKIIFSTQNKAKSNNLSILVISKHEDKMTRKRSAEFAKE